MSKSFSRVEIIRNGVCGGSQSRHKSSDSQAAKNRKKDSEEGSTTKPPSRVSSVKNRLKAHKPKSSLKTIIKKAVDGSYVVEHKWSVLGGEEISFSRIAYARVKDKTYASIKHIKKQSKHRVTVVRAGQEKKEQLVLIHLGTSKSPVGKGLLDVLSTWISESFGKLVGYFKTLAGDDFVLIKPRFDPAAISVFDLGELKRFSKDKSRPVRQYMAEELVLKWCELYSKGVVFGVCNQDLVIATPDGILFLPTTSTKERRDVLVVDDKKDLVRAAKMLFDVLGVGPDHLDGDSHGEISVVVSAIAAATGLSYEDVSAHVCTHKQQAHLVF